MEVGFCCCGVGVLCKGFKFLGWMKKLNNNNNTFHPAPKFETLAALFDF